MNPLNHKIPLSDGAMLFTIQMNDVLSILDLSAETLETRLLSADAAGSECTPRIPRVMGALRLGNGGCGLRFDSTEVCQ
jgi:hypothetical protein